MACKAARGALGRQGSRGGDHRLPGTQACAGKGGTHLRHLPNGARSGGHPAAQPAPQGGLAASDWRRLLGAARWGTRPQWQPFQPNNYPRPLSSCCLRRGRWEHGLQAPWSTEHQRAEGTGQDRERMCLARSGWSLGVQPLDNRDESLKAQDVTLSPGTRLGTLLVDGLWEEPARGPGQNGR